jgi:hypothetical protein
LMMPPDTLVILIEVAGLLMPCKPYKLECMIAPVLPIYMLLRLSDSRPQLVKGRVFLDSNRPKKYPQQSTLRLNRFRPLSSSTSILILFILNYPAWLITVTVFPLSPSSQLLDLISDWFPVNLCPQILLQSVFFDLKRKILFERFSNWHYQCHW